LDVCVCFRSLSRKAAELDVSTRNLTRSLVRILTQSELIISENETCNLKTMPRFHLLNFHVSNEHKKRATSTHSLCWAVGILATKP
jgi:hypothetical protein